MVSRGLGFIGGGYTYWGGGAILIFGGYPNWGGAILIWGELSLFEVSFPHFGGSIPILGHLSLFGGGLSLIWGVYPYFRGLNLGGGSPNIPHDPSVLPGAAHPLSSWRSSSAGGGIVG